MSSVPPPATGPAAPVDAGVGTIDGRLHLFGFPEFPARVRVARHDPASRTRRAAKALALCWGLAIASVLIPIAHFVLVPGFFVAGFVLFARRMSEAASVLGATGHCPRCNADRQFLATGRLKEHGQARCPVCRNEFSLEIERGLVRQERDAAETH